MEQAHAVAKSTSDSRLDSFHDAIGTSFRILPVSPVLTVDIPEHARIPKRRHHVIDSLVMFAERRAPQFDASVQIPDRLRRAADFTRNFAVRQVIQWQVRVCVIPDDVAFRRGPLHDSTVFAVFQLLALHKEHRAKAAPL
jgi:hypothetical protein